MTIVLAGLIGLILGWILEYLMDLFYFRNKRICGDAEKQLRASVRQLEADNSQMNNVVADLNSELEAKDADMHRQAARYQAAQNDTVKQLEMGNSQLRERVGILERDLTVKNAEFDELANQTQTIDTAALQRLQDENADLATKNAELRGSVHDKDAEIQKLLTQRDAPPPAPQAAAPAPMVSNVAAATTGFSAAAAAPAVPDDLKKLWGIGPALERILNRNGISTFNQLGDTSVERLDEILEGAGTRFQLANQKTWPQQARLAQRGAWDELERIQKGMSWD